MEDVEGASCRQEKEDHSFVKMPRRGTYLNFDPDLPVLERIATIQRYIEGFDYNYTGQPFIQMKKNRGAAHIEACVHQIIDMALPIQCVEAVFLGCWYTAPMRAVERVPLSFKSNFRYRHNSFLTCLR
jgi:hypothetical protein